MVVRVLVYFVNFRLWDCCLPLLIIIVFRYWLHCFSFMKMCILAMILSALDGDNVPVRIVPEYG